MANDRLPPNGGRREAEHVRRIFTGDNLAVMQGMDAESVDLIYLDPPFNSNRDYGAPITLRESEYEGQIAEFVDTWEYTDKDAEWRFVIAREEPAVDAVIEAAAQAHSYRMGGYLCMMGARILEMRRLMKPTASVYLHCDPTASHYLKAIMDATFGRRQFRNEIVWSYRKMPNNAQHFQRNHDIILFYANGSKPTFNKQYEDYAETTKRRMRSSAKIGYNANYAKNMATVWDWDKYHAAVASGKIPPDLAATEFKGQGSPMRAVWDIPFLQARMKERVGYPTQKPLALLERIIKASSNPGDVVLDPFAGCATACVAAERLDRQWIGIDVSDMAAKLVVERLQREYNAGGLPAYSERGITFHPDDVERITIRGRARANRYQDRRPELYKHQGGICAGCKWRMPEHSLAVDHIKPRSKGGTDELANLQLLCSGCNSLKGTGTMRDLARALKERGVI